jgi:alkylation response protein AidB-like acyl-CoA dehydrogenase
MDLSPDPVQVQLRRALRAGLAGVAATPGVRGAPASDDPASSAHDVLTGLGVARYEAPVAVGGLALGLTAGVTVSEELGRAACGNPFRAVVFTADAALACGRVDVLDRLLTGTTVAVAGMEALPPGSAIQARKSAGCWELSGTAAVDAADADLVAVLTRVGSSAVLALLPAGAAGIKWHSGRWPYVLQLTDAQALQPDLLRPINDPGVTVLARARVRQAAYLLGLASGMHDAAIAYTGVRRQFGGRLRDLQAVSFPLARAAVALRVTRTLVYRAVRLVEAGKPATAPVEALAYAADVLTDVARLTMQACGSRSMTSQLPLHRYYRLAAAEPVCYGRPGALWQLVGAAAVAGASDPRQSTGMSPER